MAEAISIEKALVLQTAACTHAGGRQSNQDALHTSREGALCCHIVTDGAGGHAGGELASRLVVESMSAAFRAAPGFSPEKIIEWFSQATRLVAQQQMAEANTKAMSATAAMLLLEMLPGQEKALWGHLGDTRIYFFRQQKMHALTKDHSVVQQFIDAGFCTPEQGRVHPQRHVLYAAIGAEGEAIPTVTEKEVVLQAGDAFLICSDGLWEWLEQHEMEQSLGAAVDVQAWLNALQEIANECASHSLAVRDNTTAIAVWVRAADES